MNQSQDTENTANIAAEVVSSIPRATRKKKRPSYPFMPQGAKSNDPDTPSGLWAAVRAMQTSLYPLIFVDKGKYTTGEDDIKLTDGREWFTLRFEAVLSTILEYKKKSITITSIFFYNSPKVVTQLSIPVL